MAPRKGEGAEGSMLGLIIFGASTVVGVAVFAVMLDIAQDLQTDATEAAQRASSDLLPTVSVRSVLAERLGASPGFDRIRAAIGPAPGILHLPLRTLAIQVTVPERSATYVLAEPPEGFSWTMILDAEPKVEPANPALTPGDLAEVTLDLGAKGATIGPRTEGALTFIGANTRPTKVTFRAPAALGDQVIELHGAPGQERTKWTFGTLED